MLTLLASLLSFGRWFPAFPLPIMGMVELPPHIESTIGTGQVQRLVRGRLFVKG